MPRGNQKVSPGDGGKSDGKGKASPKASPRDTNKTSDKQPQTTKGSKKIAPFDNLASNSSGKLPPLPAHSQGNKQQQSTSSDERAQASVKTSAGQPQPPRSKKWKWSNDENPMRLYNMDKQLKFARIPESQLKAMEGWQNQDVKGHKKTLYIKEVQKRNDNILNVIEQSRLEKLRTYEDRFPCLNQRKALLKCRIHINMFAYAVIQNKVFDSITLTVILLNSLTMVFEDPMEEPPEWLEIVETVFLALYTVEMFLKILGMGFIFNKGAYLRDVWGDLDFVIVMTAYFTLFSEPPKQGIVVVEGEGGGANLNALRAFRVLRPLRTITSVKGLRVLVVSILSALPMLKQTILVLFFFFLIFAIAGVQLLSGILKQRCIEVQSGKVYLDETGEDVMCGGVAKCPEDIAFCGKGNENPNYGSTNLDNIWYALLMVFQCTTLEGWSDIQTLYQQTYTTYICLYFLSMVFIGAFFLMNLTLAVINAAFTKSQAEAKEKKNPDTNDELGGNEEINLDEIDLKELQDDTEDIGISEYYVAKKAAKRMIEWLRFRQEHNRKKAELEKEQDRLRILAGEDNPFNMPESPSKKQGQGNDTCRSNQPMLSQQSQTPVKKFEIGNHSLMKQPETPGHQQLKPGGINVAPINQRVNNADLVITEEEIEDGADLQNHNEEVARFLADLESENLHSLPDSPGRSIGAAPVKQDKQAANMMAGIQEGIRQRCWIGNGPDSLKPMKQTSKGETARNVPGGERMTVAGYTYNDRFSDTSRLHDELDFDKIVMAPDDLKVVGKKNTDKHKDRYVDPLDSGEGFASFDDSPLFNSEDLEEDTKKHRQNSLDDLQSVIDSDNSLHAHLEDLKEQQRKVNAEEQAKKKMPPEVTEFRKQMINSIKQKIRRHQSSINFEADPLGELSQSTLEVRNEKRQKKILNDLASITQMSGTIHNDHGQNDTKATVFNQQQLNQQKALATGGTTGSNFPGDPNNNGPLGKSASVAQMAKLKRQMEHQEKKKQMNMGRVDEQFLKATRPKDPYEFINKRTQKIEINPGVGYKSTSANEVFEPRIFSKRAKALTSVNQFIAKPVNPDDVDSEEYGADDFAMGRCEPWQSKAVYKVKCDDPLDHDSDENEDDLQENSQPFETVMSIGYNHQLSHLSTRFLCRRSDILVSATLSLTLTPVEQGKKKKNLVEMDTKMHKEWVDLRHEFNALQIGQHKIPAPHFVPAYFTHQMRLTLKQDQQKQFQTSVAPLNISESQNVLPLAFQKLQKESVGMMALGGFAKMLPPCLLREPLTPEQQQLLNEEERKQYNFQKNKYEGNQRVLKKMPVQPEETYVSLADARKLKAGNYHEDDADELLEEQEQEGKGATNVTKYIGRDEDFNAKTNLEQFEKAIKQIMTEPQKGPNRNQGDEIPDELRGELDLPKSMGNTDIDFGEVRKKDCNVKRKTPYWSGQEVLNDNLNEDKSRWVTGYINEVRVWPKGFYGWVKKFRCLLKILVQHAIFDNSMLISVVLNTIVMAMEAYGNSPAKNQFLESANYVFTWIFIVEMTLKQLAVGPAKYVNETMNILDGSVVLLSIFELAVTTGGDSNLSAFKTIRILRTLRVLRIVRILRALKQMQVIIAVIQRSASSFVYIAMLLLVCCFIFTLLGKTVFGNKFNYEPRPRGNFDSFSISLITVFQVLTMENWQTVAFDAMRSDIGPWIPAVYFITWIFAGNFILLNLFLAILLDSFLEEDEAGEMSEDQLEELKVKRQRRKEAREQERIRKLKKLGMSMMRSGNVQAVIRQQTMKKKAALNQFVNLAHYNKGDDLIVDDIEDLDADTIREMFMDQGILKDKTNKRKQAQQYSGVFCDLSFYVFPKESNFRKFCYNIQSAKWFDNTVMVLIALNSIKLGADTYLLESEPDSPIVVVSNVVDYFFNIAFAVECVFKCISLGLIMDGGSYLRDGWNQLDFFIVATSLVDMILGFFVTLDIGIFKILRLLRTLRPLRVISHNVAMKMIVAALFESVGAIFNVMIVVLVVWLMFAILAINLLSGKSFYCSSGVYKHHTKYACNVNGGSWERYDSNYDNIMQAMMTLFIVSTLEGWPDVMLQSVDSTEAGEGPRQEAATVYIYFYIIFIFIGSFFLLNFFIGVLFLEYAKAQREETKGYTPAHIHWMSLQRMITDAKVAHDKKNMPETMWRFRIWQFIESKCFEITIMIFIVLNMFQMASDFEGAPAPMMTFLRFTNYVFTFVFLAECILKLLVYHSAYFQTAWNKFDFFVVCASLFDLALEFLDTESMKDLAIGNVAKVLRVLRVSRVLRLAQSSQELQALIQTITMSFGALVNVFLLLLLILFMFAVLGVFFFNPLSGGDVIDEHYKNFKNFDKAYLLLFAIATGEDWNKLMYDCLDTKPDCTDGSTCGVSAAPVFYITFIMVITHVMLNLFILVIIQQFETYYVAEDNPIKTFKTNFDVFHEVWVKFTQRFRCVKIKEKQLVDFFSSLPAPMGMKAPNEDDSMSDSELKKLMLKMGIRTEDGWIYFNELLYRCMRRVHGNFKLNKKMQITELKTLFKISLLTLKAKSEEKFKQSNNEDIIQELTKKGQSVNPFLTLMYYRISFNTWLNATRKDRQLMSSRNNFLQQDEGKLPGSVDVWIEVEDIIEVSSEEEEDDIEAIKDINTGKELKKVASSERFNKKRSSLGRENTMGKRKLSNQDTLDLQTSQKKKNRRQSVVQKGDSSQRVGSPASASQTDLK